MIVCVNAMTTKRTIKIESGVGTQEFHAFGNRRIWIEGFQNNFVLMRMYWEDSRQYVYAVMDEDSRVVVATAKNIHFVLRELERFLAPLEQIDIDEYINHNIE